MSGLVSEIENLTSVNGDSEFVDLALISVVRKVEHHEISGYHSARELAIVLSLDEVGELLKESLEEEVRADLLLSDLAEEIMSGAVHMVNQL